MKNEFETYKHDERSLISINRINKQTTERLLKNHIN